MAPKKDMCQPKTLKKRKVHEGLYFLVTYIVLTRTLHAFLNGKKKFISIIKFLLKLLKSQFSTGNQTVVFFFFFFNSTFSSQSV